MNRKTKKDASPGKAIAIASAVAAVVIVVVILLLLRSCGAPADDHGGIEFDPSATEGGWDEADTDLMIVNEEVNNYPQVVEISRDDTGELIYKSGAIPVGSKIESAKLSVDLDPGTYKCTALFYNVDPDTGDYLGCAGAVVTVTVLE